MNRSSIVAPALLCALLGVERAGAQPVLNRVEQLLRDQLGNPRGAAAAQAPAPAEPGYLGITGDDRQEMGRGVRVLNVVAGSAADQAGLQANDLITSINGQPIRAIDDMAAIVDGKPVGTKLTIGLIREGNQREQTVTLGRRTRSRPAPSEELPNPNEPSAEAPLLAQGPRLGLRTVPVTDEVRRANGLPETKGASVVSVATGSPADSAGIPLGAVITALNGRPINTPQELASAVRAATNEPIDLTYVHRGETVRKKVALAEVAPPLEGPRLQLRGKPPAPPVPHLAPGDGVPAPADPATRIAALEARIQELEQRIEKLEAAAARDAK